MKPSANMDRLIRKKRNQPDVDVLFTLYAEQNGRCYYCKKAIPYGEGNKEHKQPRSKGGTNFKENLAFTCIPCNTAKGAMTEAQFAESRGQGKKPFRIRYLAQDQMWQVSRYYNSAVYGPSYNQIALCATMPEAFTIINKRLKGLI